jgi:spore germination cell wall hydrolase CwlJ-like protein
MLQSDVDMVFLALCLWRECRNQMPLCRLAVAYVVMTRVSEGGWWGSNTCEVLFHPDQFSSLTAKDDPQLRTWPDSGDKTWADCLWDAQQAYQGRVSNPCPTADSYFDTSIPAPEWAKEAAFIKQIGAIRFYRTR